MFASCGNLYLHTSCLLRLMLILFCSKWNESNAHVLTPSLEKFRCIYTTFRRGVRLRNFFTRKMKLPNFHTRKFPDLRYIFLSTFPQPTKQELYKGRGISTCTSFSTALASSSCSISLSRQDGLLPSRTGWPRHTQNNSF